MIRIGLHVSFPLRLFEFKMPDTRPGQTTKIHVNVYLHGFDEHVLTIIRFYSSLVRRIQKIIFIFFVNRKKRKKIA